MTTMPAPVSTKVTIDLGELYAPLMRVSVDEVRTIKEQILYYIKRSLKINGIIVDERAKEKARWDMRASNDDSFGCSYYAEENRRPQWWF